MIAMTTSNSISVNAVRLCPSWGSSLFAAAGADLGDETVSVAEYRIESYSALPAPASVW